jgi:ankyrin repeat protein
MNRAEVQAYGSLTFCGEINMNNVTSPSSPFFEVDLDSNSDDTASSTESGDAEEPCMRAPSRTDSPLPLALSTVTRAPDPGKDKTQIIVSGSPKLVPARNGSSAKQLRDEARRHALLLHQSLIKACKSGKERALSQVRQLLASGADVNRRDPKGNTALHHAAKYGNSWVTIELIDHHTDINAETRDGYTPLMLAARNRRGEVLEILAAYGPRPSGQDADGTSSSRPVREPDFSFFRKEAARIAGLPEKERMAAVDKAVQSGQMVTVARMIAAGSISLEESDHHARTLLAIAAQRGDEAMIRLLLCAGARVDAVDMDWNTPLMHAVKQKQPKAIRALLQGRASTSQTNHEGQSALSMAVDANDIKVMQALLDGRADIWQAPSSMPTAVMQAALKEQTLMVKNLLELRADLPDGNGSLALAQAAKSGELKALETLLRAGADPQHQAWDGHTAFTLAAANGHEALVLALLGHVPANARDDARKKWAQLLQNQTDNDGRSALMLAVLNKKGDMTQLLLEHGADLEKRDHSGRNALLWAAARAGGNMVELLIGHHATHVGMDRQDNNALILAAENNNLEVVKLLCWPRYKNSMFNIDTPNKAGDTALIVAARHGFVDMVKFLLQKQANLVHYNSLGRTALLEAGAHGHEEVIALLQKAQAELPPVYPVLDQVLKAIANAAPITRNILPALGPVQVRQKDKHGNSMLALASSNGQASLVKSLLRLEAQPEGASSAAATAPSDDQDLALAECGTGALIMRPADIDIEVANKEGLTPLCLATRNGHYSTIKLLIETGASVNHLGEGDITPLWLACRLRECAPENNHHTDLRHQHWNPVPENIVSLLLGHGADAHQPSFQGQTPLIAASAAGRQGVVEQLIVRYAEVNRTDIHGLTPLMHAAHFGHWDVVTLLLNNGALPDPPPGHLSALILAAESGHDDVVELLIKRGAQVNRADAGGDTALINASRAGNLSTVQLLLRLGASRMQKNHNGHDAVHHAEKAHHYEIVEALRQGQLKPRDH